MRHEEPRLFISLTALVPSLAQRAASAVFWSSIFRPLHLSRSGTTNPLLHTV